MQLDWEAPEAEFWLRGVQNATQQARDTPMPLPVLELVFFLFPFQATVCPATPALFMKGW